MRRLFGAGPTPASRLKAELPTRKVSFRGFSLVEVVLALGIFAFALISVLYLFGNLMGNADALAKRREALAMTESLRNHLNFRGTDSESDWTNAYAEIVNGAAADLYGAAVHWNWTSNAPDADSDDVTFVWTNGAGVSAIESARSGPLYRVKLELDPGLSPVTSLPPSASAYSNALIVVRASLYTVGAPGGSLTNAPLAISTLIPVIR